MFGQSGISAAVLPSEPSTPTLEASNYARLRLAFEGYIRDRHHRIGMSDADVKDEIDRWLDAAEDVEDVK